MTAAVQVNKPIVTMSIIADHTNYTIHSSQFKMVSGNRINYRIVCGKYSSTHTKH